MENYKYTQGLTASAAKSDGAPCDTEENDLGGDDLTLCMFLFFFSEI